MPFLGINLRHPPKTPSFCSPYGASLVCGEPTCLSAAELMIADIQAHDLPVSQTLRKYAQRILDYTHDSPEVHMWVVVFENGPA